jgi:voltage-gated potassium channel Kch
MMRYVLFCPDGLLEDVAGATALPGDAPVYVVTRPALRARLARTGRPVIVGDVTDPDVYAKAGKTHRGPIVVGMPRTRLGRAVAAAREALPALPLLAVTDDARTVAGVTTVPLSSLGESLIRPALDRAITRARVERIRERFEDAERVLILMQDDPDPDAIASALALKVLLGRTRTSAPLCTFGTITRPENLTMCKILEIDVEEIDARALAQFDRIAMVDVQPSFLEEPIGEVDLVIDHHPVERPFKSRMKDVRPSYGATSTISSSISAPPT